MTRLIFILITLTTVLNGSYFWLNRVGFINTKSFDVLIEKNIDFNTRAKAYIDQPGTITPQIEAAFKHEHLHYKKLLDDHLYSNSKLSLVLKSLKYVLYLIFLTLIFYTAAQSSRLPWLRNYIILGALVLAYSGLSFFNFGIAGVIAGFNSFVFLAVLMFSAYVISLKDIRFFALLLLITLGLLLIIAPIEISKGIQVFNTNSFIGKRMTGFMDQPNTLGVYVVCIFSFFTAVYRENLNKFIFITLTLLTLLLIILSGSNTAGLVLCAFLFAEYASQKYFNPGKPGHWALALLMAAILILYFTHGRSIVESLAGRIEKYQYFFSLDIATVKLLFGYGIGAGSNTLLQIQSLLPLEQAISFPINFSIDSTPLLLIIQTGIIGCVLFYGLLVLALIKDKRMSSTYLTFILCSMSINIIEVFPLNIVLALLLSTSLMSKSQGDYR